MCLCTCVSTCVRTCICHSVTLSLSLSLSTRVHSILAPLRVLHQEVVSVQQAGTPRTCLSLWQCSDRATHLSTDALPVSGGVVARAVPLSLSLSPPFSLPLACRLSLSSSLSYPPVEYHPASTPAVLSISLALPPSVSPTLRYLVLRSTVRVSLHG